MYHIVGDLQQVRRFGRWSTDTFHVYLWESHEPIYAKTAMETWGFLTFIAQVLRILQPFTREPTMIFGDHRCATLFKGMNKPWV